MSSPDFKVVRTRRPSKTRPLTLGPCIRRGFSYSLALSLCSSPPRLGGTFIPPLWRYYKHKLSPRRRGARRAERNGARERHGYSGGGVREGELCAVQAEALVRRAAVERVAEQRVADRREVHPNLVRPARPGRELEQ